MKKKLIIVGIVVALAAAVVLFADIKKPEDFYTTVPPISDGQPTVYITIDCTTALADKKEARRVGLPEDGLVLPRTRYAFEEGESVYDLLLRVCADKKIQIESGGVSGGSTVYVRGIANLYEFDRGDLSGWEYSVNGVFPMVGCDKTQLNDGDEIRWAYTCELGRDIGEIYGGMSVKVGTDADE